MVPVNNSPVTIARRGLMLVISSPSGAGKSTIARNLLDKDKNIGLSVSVTTRPRRQSEIDGIHYHFISKRDFERLPYEPLNEDILNVPVRKVVIAVDAGRNLAVLVEAAVRSTILQLRGIDTYREFIERHQKAMQKAG